MNPFKEQKREEARQALTTKGIEFKSLNNDLHWVIGTINFYPTTGKWCDFENTSINGDGYKSLLRHLKPKLNAIKQLTVDQIFDIAKHSKDRSLMGICTAIHKEIYK